MSAAIKNIAVIAGSGRLPFLVMRQLQQDPSFSLKAMIAFEKITDCDSDMFKIPVLWTRLGLIGEIYDFLKAHDVSHVIMVGSMKRPSLFHLKVDQKGQTWVKKLARAFLGGDDCVLRKLHELIQEEGLNLVPYQLLKGKNMNLALVDDEAAQDIQKAHNILDHMSVFDIGQSLVIERGHVLGIEAAEGTQELIKRCAPLQRLSKKAILVKRKKTTQHQFLDLPTIGAQTIEDLNQFGYQGISIDFFTQVIDLEEVELKIFEYNLFLHMHTSL